MGVLGTDRFRWTGGLCVGCALLLAGCSSEESNDGGGSGGAEASADAAAGGASSGGGIATGGTAAGGGASGGRAPGGASTAGGAPTGAGGATGTGGASSGGAASGGAAALGPRQKACDGVAPVADPLPENRDATPVQGGFGFLEGPVWLADRGELLFSDMNFGGGDAMGPPGRIRRMTLDGANATFDVFVEQGNANGLALANDGRVLAATHDVQSLSYYDPATGARTNWPLTRDGKHFNSTNDLVVRADGNVYFTDPSYQLGSRDSETEVEGLYRVDPAGAVTSIDDSFDRVNGVTLSPDEDTLYVAGRSGGIQAFSLSNAGVASDKREYAPGSSDGMTVDCAGNVYTTSGAVIVTAPDGHELGRIVVPNPSNVAFGGPARKTLYITAGSSLYSIELLGSGMPY